MKASDNVWVAEEKNHLWIILFLKCIPTLEQEVFCWGLFRWTVFIHAVNMIIALFNTFHIAYVVFNILGDSRVKPKGQETPETPQVVQIKSTGAPFPYWRYLAENTCEPFGIRLGSIRKRHAIQLIGIKTGDG
jgi:hypothetical protein